MQKARIDSMYTYNDNIIITTQLIYEIVENLYLVQCQAISQCKIVWISKKEIKTGSNDREHSCINVNAYSISLVPRLHPPLSHHKV